MGSKGLTGAGFPTQHSVFLAMLLNARFPLRYIFKHIRPDVVRVLFISSFFHLLKLSLGEYLPLIPLQLPTILGSSIALLLAFKTSQSYDRWWEARKIWGANANDSRTLVLQVRTFVADASFFLLERTARYLQDPFSNKPTDTPVTAIARTVEINLKQLLHEPDVPEPLAPKGFFLM